MITDLFECECELELDLELDFCLLIVSGNGVTSHCIDIEFKESIGCMVVWGSI